jgi:hypothetical protein|tara:strand:+ start:10980 stop:11375 length:396 start_codon:yes stop_codon:yes gene_type:complete
VEKLQKGLLKVYIDLRSCNLFNIKVLPMAMNQLHQMKTMNQLEDDIMECWKVTDDLKFFVQELLDSPSRLTDDEQANILLGMETLYDRKFNRLFENWSSLLKPQPELEAEFMTPYEFGEPTLNPDDIISSL